MMPRSAFQVDYDDPFGSRPDEKPPQGWEDGFWEKVCEKIEEQQAPPGQGPGRGPLPEPAPGRGRAARLVHATMILVAAAAAAVILHDVWRTSAPPAGDPSRILVHVNGSHPPDVSVEWARLRGHASGYMVFQSIDPEVSYVLVDPRYGIADDEAPITAQTTPAAGTNAPADGTAE